MDADAAEHAAVLLWSWCSATVCADDHAVLLWSGGVRGLEADRCGRPCGARIALDCRIKPQHVSVTLHYVQFMSRALLDGSPS